MLERNRKKEMCIGGTETVNQIYLEREKNTEKVKKNDSIVPKSLLFKIA